MILLRAAIGRDAHRPVIHQVLKLALSSPVQEQSAHVAPCPAGAPTRLLMADPRLCSKASKRTSLLDVNSQCVLRLVAARTTALSSSWRIGGCRVVQGEGSSDASSEDAQLIAGRRCGAEILNARRALMIIANTLMSV